MYGYLHNIAARTLKSEPSWEEGGIELGRTIEEDTRIGCYFWVQAIGYEVSLRVSIPQVSSSFPLIHRYQTMNAHQRLRWLKPTVISNRGTYAIEMGRMELSSLQGNVKFVA